MPFLHTCVGRHFFFGPFFLCAFFFRHAGKSSLSSL
uniref:Uncharacterized protein n=1 Tax=Siphoviridae sp. ctHOG1 TaxID=2827829 RepID=A0A8S5SVL9_9CAUD|nr:MAG TPA: hypothetical protein [Siphoviridae sp. ctHOG1]